MNDGQTSNLTKGYYFCLERDRSNTNGFCRNVDDTLTLENEMLNSENLHNLLCFFLFLFGNELKATPPSCLVPC